jgi:hypothetical protein
MCSGWNHHFPMCFSRLSQLLPCLRHLRQRQLRQLRQVAFLHTKQNAAGHLGAINLPWAHLHQGSLNYYFLSYNYGFYGYNSGYYGYYGNYGYSSPPSGYYCNSFFIILSTSVELHQNGRSCWDHPGGKPRILSLDPSLSWKVAARRVRCALTWCVFK